VRQGLPVKLDLLRSGCDDEETWLQEYCCQFLSDAQNYISVELINTCVSEEATTMWSAGAAAPALKAAVATAALQRDFYLGVDIGRKRDLTIAWLFEKVGEVLWSRHLLVMKGMSFDEQEKQICRLIEGTPHPASYLGHPLPSGEGNSSLFTHHSSRPAVRRCCVDQSGVGMMLAEHLVQRYGAIVEPVTFTAQLKERLAPMVKQAFEERTVRIPDNREVRADINSVKRYVTPAGNVRFDAEHTDRGHADRFWALAMAVNAASEPEPHFENLAGLVGSPVTAGLMHAVL
jgi:phage FluMu gp28-like protein